MMGSNNAWYMKIIWQKQTDVRYSTTRPHLYIVALLTFHIVKKHVFFIKFFFIPVFFHIVL